MDKDEKNVSSKQVNNHLLRYLEYSELIISSYKGNEPFNFFLKKYFQVNKKHGSRDRKIISSLCYHYFRLGFGVRPGENFQQKLLISIFLWENRFSSFLESFQPAWNSLIEQPVIDKLNLVREEFNIEKIFPFHQELSDEIDFHKCSLSFLMQPELFIRIRPGFNATVFDKLTKAGFLFQKLNDECLAFNNNEKVSDVIEIDKEAVVQDYNSQQTLSTFTSYIQNKISIWDCCAGSGGKSILAYDRFKNSQLTVSDKRKSILENLRLRFKKAGIKSYELILADLEKPVTIVGSGFDLIIADVPCSGSGTWSRTPEQLTFFNRNEIERYSSLQKKIIENVIPHLKNNGHLLYITCSVFKKESEDNVTFIQDKFQLRLLDMQYLKGYEMRADTLFVALFKKSS
ncbi:MAG: methyltransferase domain-containing protein [Ginsengibacter sp.]